MGICRDRMHKRSATGAKRMMARKKRAFALGRPAAMTRIGEKRVRRVRCRGGNVKFRALGLETGNFTWCSEYKSFKARIATVVYHPSNNEFVRMNVLNRKSIVQIDSIPFRTWYQTHYGVQVAARPSTAGRKSAAAQKQEETPQTAAADDTTASSGAAQNSKNKSQAVASRPTKGSAVAAGGKAAAAKASPSTAKKGAEGARKHGAAGTAAAGAKADGTSKTLSPRISPQIMSQLASGRIYAIITSRPGQCGRADGYILEGKELEFYLKKIKSRK